MWTLVPVPTVQEGIYITLERFLFTSLCVYRAGSEIKSLERDTDGEKGQKFKIESSLGFKLWC